MTQEIKNIPLVGGEEEADTNSDFWLIACVPDGESVVYMDMSEDVKAKDILINGNWEDDSILPHDPPLRPGVYKFKLLVSGGQDTYDPYDHWMEIKLELLEVLWQLPAGDAECQ